MSSVKFTVHYLLNNNNTSHNSKRNKDSRNTSSIVTVRSVLFAYLFITANKGHAKTKMNSQ